MANRWRRKRVALFGALLDRVEPPIKVLDLGGAPLFWGLVGFTFPARTRLVFLNVHPVHDLPAAARAVVGDGRDMSMFGEGEFDVVFSNSVIEHVGTKADQHRFANEVRRVGRRYFVQTPYRGFPIEPHALFPGFQFLPLALRGWLLCQRNLGWFQKTPDRYEGARRAASIRLLWKRELAEMFPNARIHHERTLGLTKSLIAINGW